MNTTNKKAYTYQMKLGAANILCIIILIVMGIITFMINKNITFYTENSLLLFISIILYLMLHEFLHGVGYFIGGCKSKNIQYGICLEKGIFYAMAYQKLTKKNILISLQMPFIVIGVITYIIGIIFNINVLVLLSIINISGAAMDIVMFIYIFKLNNVIYTESGKPNEFVLISDEDLKKHKSLFLKIVDEKKYNSSDYEFGKIKKIIISKTSIIIIVIFILLGLLLSIV